MPERFGGLKGEPRMSGVGPERVNEHLSSKRGLGGRQSTALGRGCCQMVIAPKDGNERQTMACLHDQH